MYFTFTVPWCCLSHVFTYIYSLLIEKDIYDCQNVSVKLPYVYVCLSSRDLFIFLVRVSAFFSYFCVIKAFLRINLLLYLFFTVVPSNSWVFLFYRPFVINTTFSTGLVSAEVSSVSWVGRHPEGLLKMSY